MCAKINEAEMRNDWIARVLLGFILVVGITMLIFFCLLSGGCTRKVYIPVETIRTEYKDKINTEYIVDSVTDTRFVFIKGDTVIDYRDRVKWREREVHDSIYINKTDTIRVPYPVEKELTKWEQAKMDVGGIAIVTAIALFIGLCISVVWLIKKGRR